MPISKIDARDYDVYKGSQVPIKSWTRGVLIQSKAIDQLKNLAALPFIHKWIAAMPDIHPGLGSVVGSVIPTIGAIIPAAVGLDIGCGMFAVRTGLVLGDLPKSLKQWRLAIEKAVPHGFGKESSHIRGAWSHSGIPKATSRLWANKLEARHDAILAKHKSIAGKTLYEQLGTLGSGNHFIEICIDQEERVWLMLHSGSRGVGNRIGRYFTGLARDEMDKHFIHLPDKDLAYFVEDSTLFDDYIEAMMWAQDFAQHNRDLMVAQVFDALKQMPGVPQKKLMDHEVSVNCHHNFTTQESHFGKNPWITRKGAICARKGVLGIIPGSMGSESFIVEGKGNPDSFHSCAHGAGRLMSRSQAKKLFTLDDLIEDTEGVECRKVESLIDETEKCYKPVKDVMAAQKSLVDTKFTLKGVLCVKG